MMSLTDEMNMSQEELWGAEPTAAVYGPNSSKTLPATMQKHVFVVEITMYQHSRDVSFDDKVVGVFASKEEAVAHIPSQFEFFPYTLQNQPFVAVIQDNRDNPPDNGVLLELQYGEEGGKDEIRITKVPFVSQALWSGR